MENPLVSVTIISYNQGHLIAGAIESVLNQDYPHIELVISDDASTDNSVEVIRSYAEKYPDKIKAIYADKNLGFSGNRERSIRACTGEYLQMVDADDSIEPDKTKEMVAFMQAHPECALCYGNVRIVREGEKDELFFDGERLPREGDASTLLLWDNFIPTAGCFIRMSGVEGGGYHSPFGFTHSEGHFYVRVLRHGTLRYLNKIVGNYRRHNQSAMATSQGIAGRVRKDKERALLSMYKEFRFCPDLKKYVRYALVRLYLDGLVNAVKAKSVKFICYYAFKLLPFLGKVVSVYRDRRKGIYLQKGIR